MYRKRFVCGYVCVRRERERERERKNTMYTEKHENCILKEQEWTNTYKENEKVLM